MGITMKDNQFARTAAERQSNLHARATAAGHPAVLRNYLRANRRFKQRNIAQKLALTFIFGTLAVVSFAFWLAPLALGIWALVFGINDLNSVGVNGWAIVWVIIGTALILRFFFRGRK